MSESLHTELHVHTELHSALIMHAYDARETFTSKGNIHIIHAYGFTTVLWYKPTIYDLLVFKQVTRT